MELLSNREQEDRRTTLQTEALKHQETAMENGAVNASGISLAHLRRGQEFDIVFHNLSGLVSYSNFMFFYTEEILQFLDYHCPATFVDHKTILRSELALLQVRWVISFSDPHHLVQNHCQESWNFSLQEIWRHCLKADHFRMSTGKSLKPMGNNKQPHKACVQVLCSPMFHMGSNLNCRREETLEA